MLYPQSINSIDVGILPAIIGNLFRKAIFIGSAFADIRGTCKTDSVSGMRQLAGTLRFVRVTTAAVESRLYRRADATPLAELLFVLGEQDSLFTRQRHFAEIKFSFGLA